MLLPALQVLFEASAALNDVSCPPLDEECTTQMAACWAGEPPPVYVPPQVREQGPVVAKRCGTVGCMSARMHIAQAAGNRRLLSSKVGGTGLS